MSIKPYAPCNEIFSDEQTALVVFNQVGATNTQDLGRDAQYLADHTGMHVLGVDRPGTAGFIPNKGLAERMATPDGYVNEMSKIGKQIDRRLDDLGITRAVAAGRSAGGLAVLSLASSETVGALGHVFAAEPVGVQKRTVADGLKHFTDYGKLQKEMLATDSQNLLIKPDKPGLGPLDAFGRLISLVPAFAYDKYHNSEPWASDAGLRYMADLALNSPDIDVRVEFAQTSLATSVENYNNQIAPIAGLRTSGAPFSIVTTPDTVHSSYDKRAYFLERLAPTIERATNSNR